MTVYRGRKHTGTEMDNLCSIPDKCTFAAMCKKIVEANTNGTQGRHFALLLVASSGYVWCLTHYISQSERRVADLPLDNACRLEIKYFGGQTSP